MFLHQGRSYQAVDFHGDQRAATLGHLVFGTTRYAEELHELRSRAVGVGPARRRHDTTLHAGVAQLPVQVRLTSIGSVLVHLFVNKYNTEANVTFHYVQYRLIFV